MSEKTVHIVFKVLNFLVSVEVNRLNLLPIDKWLLTILAKHHGEFGIFPNQTTLAREAHISLRYAKQRIKFLEDSGVISIKRMNRKNHYFLDFLSMIGEPQITSSYPQQLNIGEPQITSQVNHRSPHRGSTVHTNNILNNQSKKKERERKVRAPLSEDFVPDNRTKALIKSLSFEPGVADQVGDHFMEHFLDSGEPRKDWQFEARKWFRRERKIIDDKPAKVRMTPAPQPQPTRDTRSPSELEPKKYTDPAQAKEFMKGILGKLNGKGGHAHGVLETNGGDEKTH